MEVQVLAKKENPFLKRTEVTFKAIHKAEATPSRDALRAELAKQLKASKEHVVVDHARSTFGRFETLGYAKVYKSKEEALGVERGHVLVRNKLKEPEVKESKEGAKAEKPPRAEAPKKEEKAEAKPEHKPEAKPEHKPEAKGEHKGEHKEEKAPAKEAKKEAPKPAPAAEKKEEKHEEKKAEGKPEAKKAAPKKKEG